MTLQRARRTFGLGLMVSSMLLAVVSPLAASAAEGDVPEERTTVAAEDISRQAFWNGKTSEAIPTAVTKQFPPEAVCLVAPQACNFPTGDEDPTAGSDPTGGAITGLLNGDDEDPGEPGLGALGNELIAQINEQYTGGVGQLQEADPGAPADPVPPGALPVSVAFGQAHYRAAIQFALPAVPEGDRVDEFTVYFPQGNPTFSNASPALRQAVLATLTCARETETGFVKPPDAEVGRCEMAEFEKVAADPANDLRDDTPLPFQLCPVGPDPVSGEDAPTWVEGASQSEDDLPTANCLLGSLGEELELDGTTYWAFDLSLAMAAWADGTLPYEGMVFLPGAAENFAFGDPETTYNKQVTLMNEGIQYAFATSPKPAPPAPFTPPPTTTTTNTAAPPATSGGGDLFGTPPTPAANSPVSVPQSSTPPATTTEQPAVAGGNDAPAVSQPNQEVVAQPAATPGGSDWYVWLLLIPFLLGAYLLSRSLEEEAVLVAERGGGAMTRLLERQAAQRGPDLVG